MLYLLGFLCAALVVWNGILLIKIAGMRRAADEICAEVDSRLGRDTNVGIDITISDDKMRRLAAEIDRQMRRLRKEHIRYLQGDRELKEAVTNICARRLRQSVGIWNCSSRKRQRKRYVYTWQ